MALTTQWTWVWINSGSWWWTGRSGVLQFMGSQRVGHDWATELTDTRINLIWKFKQEWGWSLCMIWKGPQDLLLTKRNCGEGNGTTPVLLPGKSGGRRSLQSMGSRRVRDDWATSLSLFTFMHWRRQWQATPVFVPGESQGAWWAAIYGVAQSRTRLKRQQ